MYGHTRLDRIRNEAIREKLGVESIEDNMKETKLRRFDHARLRRYETINLSNYRRDKGRPKKSWNEVIKYKLNYIGLKENMAKDNSFRRFRIKIADHR